MEKVMEARSFCPAVILSFLLLVFSLPLSAEEVGSTVVFSEAGDVIAVGGACPESDADDESFAWVRSIIVLRFVDNRAPSDLAERLYGALLSKGSDGVLHFFSGGELERPLILVPQRSVFADVGFTSQYVRERYGLVPGNYDVLAVDFYSWGTRSNSGLTLNEALDIAVVELERFPGSEPESIDWGKISALPATMGCNSGGPGSISCSCDGSFWIVDDGCSVVCGETLMPVVCAHSCRAPPLADVLVAEVAPSTEVLRVAAGVPVEERLRQVVVTTTTMTMTVGTMKRSNRASAH